MKKALCLLCLLLPVWPAFGFEKETTLSLPAEGLSRLVVDAGAGSLKIEGVEGLSSVEVKADIEVRGIRASRMEEFLEEHLRLSLEKSGPTAVLKGYFHFSGISFFAGEASIDLTVRMPRTMDLEVDDGSGAMAVRNIRGEVVLDDGSGDLTVERIEGDLSIDDGSGDIEVRDVTGEVEVDDGSGSIDIVQVGRDVTVDDGSGGIYIEDVGGDVILESTGSGSVRTVNIRGRVID